MPKPPLDPEIPRLLQDRYGPDCVQISNRRIKLTVQTPHRGIRAQFLHHLASSLGGVCEPYQGFIRAKIGGYTVVVKPAKIPAAPVVYGALVDLIHTYNTLAFQDVCSWLPERRLPFHLKELSDRTAVSELNQHITDALQTTQAGCSGITMTLHQHTIANVVGCVPIIVSGEPKADCCFVSRVQDDLVPSYYFSFKMGSSPADFNQYGGLTKRQWAGAYQHPEIQSFLQDVYQVNHETPAVFEPWRPIQDPTLQQIAVFGHEFGQESHSIHNCHAMVQGTPILHANLHLEFAHTHLNGEVFGNTPYTPVFGARRASGRVTQSDAGPIRNLRLGTFARGYRASWGTDDTIFTLPQNISAGDPL